jgi:hypothetical protein
LIWEAFIMRCFLRQTCAVLLAALMLDCPLQGRGFGGFGGFRAGGFGGYHYGGWGGDRWGGGFHADDWGGDRYGGFGGYHGYSGYRSGSSYWGDRGGYAGGSYDRNWYGSRGGSLSVEGSRGIAAGPGGAVAGGTRDVTATGPEGRSYTGERSAGAAVGPGGNVVAGGSRAGVASGPGGTIAGGSRAGFASGPGGTVAGGSRAGFASGPGGTVAGGSRWGAGFTTDGGLARYSDIGVGGFAHSTALWPNNYMASRAGYVRGGFGYWNSFTPGWYGLHPGAWTAPGWAAGAAWAAATWPDIASWVNVPTTPYYYDYGNTIVYQGGNVYVDGDDAGTAAQYAQQAQTIADQGREGQPPVTTTWHPLGVFALVQGAEKTSNTIFQLAINQDGILRGNYYDALMNSTSPVYGSVDKTTERAAWSIGNQKDTVFETGLYNLTRDQAPLLVHFGKDRTQQWLLVRMQQQPGEQK